MRRRSFLHILGIDLGGGKGKKTALATLRVDAHEGVTVVGLDPRPGAAPFYDHTLTQALRSFGDGTLICVDAPLTLPPCLRCTVPVCPGQEACVDPAVVTMRRLAGEIAETRSQPSRGKPAVTPYTQRPSELFLAARRHVVAREGLGQGTGPLAARAALLVRALADRYRLNENLIEVHPRTTLQLLGLSSPFKRHLKEREHRAHLLESLAPTLKFGPGIWREHCVQSDHLFEAVITAFTGYLWARDGWQVPSEMGGSASRDGWIWVPPPPDVDALESAAAEA